MIDKQADTFADLLRGWRESAGLTQEELAERAGLTPNAISALERGERTHPYPQTVRALAEALNLRPEDQARLAASVPRRRVPQPTVGTRAGTARAAQGSAGTSHAGQFPVVASGSSEVLQN
jgi:transcriptional regulator with XRE-family HTH domain